MFSLEGETSGADGPAFVELGDAADVEVAAKGVAASVPLSLVRLRAAVATPGTEPPPAGTAGEANPASRQVSFAGRAADVPVFDWSTLAQGTVVTGPALIESDDTTVVVPPGAEASVGSWGEASFRHLERR
jgi:N-methylhydantoinase A/oxoprolinase/acetone carboxylase beta subunit